MLDFKAWIEKKKDNKKVSKELIKKYFGPELTKWETLKINIDFRMDHLFYGSDLIDYLQYGFYWQKNIGRRRFGTAQELRETMAICNDKEKSAYFDQKPLFNAKFDKFIRRKWLNAQDCTYEDFEDFIKNQRRFFIKPDDSFSGYGTGIYTYGGVKDCHELYAEYQKGHVLMEELVKQHAKLASINENTVNTLRIVSLLKADNTVEILAAVFRVGRKGKVADNFHQGGIASLVDIDTGIVKTTGIDGAFQRHVIHPDSGIPIVGFQIPAWQEILDMIREAAQMVPEVRYVGWDAAVGQDGIPLLIEGNSNPDFDVTQVSDQVGKWPKYIPLLQEIRRMKRG